jgi:hypothetical protein
MDETTKAAMVHQLNPNATHMTNHYYGNQLLPKECEDVYKAFSPEESQEEHD